MKPLDSFKFKLVLIFLLTHEEKNSEIVSLLFLMDNEGTWEIERIETDHKKIKHQNFFRS